MSLTHTGGQTHGCGFSGAGPADKHPAAPTAVPGHLVRHTSPRIPPLAARTGRRRRRRNRRNVTLRRLYAYQSHIAPVDLRLGLLLRLLQKVVGLVLQVQGGLLHHGALDRLDRARLRVRQARNHHFVPIVPQAPETPHWIRESDSLRKRDLIKPLSRNPSHACAAAGPESGAIPGISPRNLVLLRLSSAGQQAPWMRWPRTRSSRPSHQTHLGSMVGAT
jgi:hypothetical protein